MAENIFKSQLQNKFRTTRAVALCSAAATAAWPPTHDSDSDSDHCAATLSAAAAARSGAKWGSSQSMNGPGRPMDSAIGRHWRGARWLGASHQCSYYSTGAAAGRAGRISAQSTAPGRGSESIFPLARFLPRLQSCHFGLFRRHIGSSLAFSHQDPPGAQLLFPLPSPPESQRAVSLSLYHRRQDSDDLAEPVSSQFLITPMTQYLSLALTQ